MSITVMTFNLRYDKPDPGIQQWEKRFTAIASLIQHYQPDLLGTQEGKIHQLGDLQSLLPEYQYIGGDRTGTGKGEHCAIFYKHQVLKLEETQDFYLSDTPEIPGSITWGNRLPRMATWGTFSIHSDPISITIVNTHLDHENAKARDLGAALVNEKLTQFSDENYLLLTGDFNTSPHNAARKVFANNPKIQDSLSSIPLEKQKTFHNFTGSAWDAIDTIYCDRRFQIQQITIDDKQWDGLWPSDHFPVIARISF